MSDDTPALRVWRHPPARGAAGRCIGSRSDLPVDPRKAKRLAHRVRAGARREGLPHAVVTSPLQRAADVGRWLRRWGWRHAVDAALAEVDFGDWDGRTWETIGRAAVDAWCVDLHRHRPGGGESVEALLQRVAAWRPPAGVRIVVGHGGWLSAALWLAEHGSRSEVVPTPATWLPAPRQASCVRLAVDGRVTSAR